MSQICNQNHFHKSCIDNNRIKSKFCNHSICAKTFDDADLTFSTTDLRLLFGHWLLLIFDSFGFSNFAFVFPFLFYFLVFIFIIFNSFSFFYFCGLFSVFLMQWFFWCAIIMIIVLSLLEYSIDFHVVTSSFEICTHKIMLSRRQAKHIHTITLTQDQILLKIFELCSTSWKMTNEIHFDTKFRHINKRTFLETYPDCTDVYLTVAHVSQQY